jgi:hypothetical protein
MEGTASFLLIREVMKSFPDSANSHVKQAATQNKKEQEHDIKNMNNIYVSAINITKWRYSASSANTE